jgi:hypothetical protein
MQRAATQLSFGKQASLLAFGVAKGQEMSSKLVFQSSQDAKPIIGNHIDIDARLRVARQCESASIVGLPSLTLGKVPLRRSNLEQTIHIAWMNGVAERSDLGRGHGRWQGGSKHQQREQSQNGKKIFHNRFRI